MNRRSQPAFIMMCSIIAIISALASVIILFSFGIINASAGNEIEIRPVGHSDPGGTSIDVVVDGNFAYVADGTKGVAFINISDPYNPTRTKDTYYNTDGFALDIAVNGDIVYVADGSKGLVILDVSNKSDPMKIGHYENGYDIYDVVVIDDYAYIANEQNGLLILDVSNPDDIQWVGQNDTGGSGTGAQGLTVVDNIAYVADRHAGIYLIDVSNPYDPVRIGHNSTADQPTEVFVTGDLAYVANNENGMVILDVSNPGNISWKSRYDSPGRVHGVEKVGNYVYAADNLKGLLIINVSDPNNPTKAASIDTQYWHYGLTVSGNYVYVADEGNGLVIYELVPIAHIDGISSNQSFFGQTITFKGHGTDNDLVGICEWNSSIDGVFSTDLVSSYSTLSIGQHNISFRVQDSHGIWSQWVNWSDAVNISANEIPTASIESVSPNPATFGEMIYFNGSATDDGSIDIYLWFSSEDGEIYNGKDPKFSDSNLSQGNHTITLKVQDNHGVWSKESSILLVILEKEEDTTDLNDSTEDSEGDDLFLLDPIGPFPLILYPVFIIVVIGIILGWRKRSGSKNGQMEPKPQTIPQQSIPPISQTYPQQPNQPQFQPQLQPQEPPVQQLHFSAGNQIQQPSPPQSPSYNALNANSWYCSQCGKNNDSQYRFCMNCGLKNQ